jgi:hypothetical protein
LRKTVLFGIQVVGAEKVEFIVSTDLELSHSEGLSVFEPISRMDHFSEELEGPRLTSFSELSEDVEHVHQMLSFPDSFLF